MRRALAFLVFALLVPALVVAKGDPTGWALSQITSQAYNDPLAAPSSGFLCGRRSAPRQLRSSIKLIHGERLDPRPPGGSTQRGDTAAPR